MKIYQVILYTRAHGKIEIGIRNVCLSTFRRCVVRRLVLLNYLWRKELHFNVCWRKLLFLFSCPRRLSLLNYLPWKKLLFNAWRHTHWRIILFATYNLFFKNLYFFYFFFYFFVQIFYFFFVQDVAQLFN